MHSIKCQSSKETAYLNSLFKLIESLSCHLCCWQGVSITSSPSLQMLMQLIDFRMDLQYKVNYNLFIHLYNQSKKKTTTYVLEYD